MVSRLAASCSTFSFYDTSAWVPLLLDEPSAQLMWTIKPLVAEAWAWGWMRGETEAALTRRKATPAAWSNWHILKNEVNWVDLEPVQHETLCAFNRTIGLRAADAGHLFVFDRLFSELPQLEFLSLDRDQVAAARRIGLPVHDACP